MTDDPISKFLADEMKKINKNNYGITKDKSMQNIEKKLDQFNKKFLSDFDRDIKRIYK